MVKVTIDGSEIEVENGLTVMQACEQAGKEIPKFCYNERLSIAGNCRMCLVEVEKTPKLQASCAYPVSDGMVIHTDSPSVKRAREGVLEFLLINHPLDCPICDQGGECDLQDQAYFYGKGSNRFSENKRSVEDKDFGPLIKTHMNRCIHCTRCIRFSSQIAGVPELGATGRGEDMEVGTYIARTITSELSGNMIDLCPVGALTSKPYSYRARSWELTKTESIDVLDAVGSNIVVDSKGREVMRILPRLNEEINEVWISDKTRFSYDGLKYQRLDVPYIRDGGKLRESSWEDAYKAIIKKFKNIHPDEIAAIAGDLADVESVFALKKLMTNIGTKNLECRTYGEKINPNTRSSYLFNTSIQGIEQSDLCILVGVNPRHDAALINARIRKRYLQGNFEVISIGCNDDLTYPVSYYGDDPLILSKIITNKKHEIAEKLLSAKNPMIIVGVDALSRPDGLAILATAQKIAEKYKLVRDDWNGFNILHKSAGRVGALDLGFVPSGQYKDLSDILSAAEKNQIKMIFMLGGDEIEVTKLKNCFVVYIGHHGDKCANLADVILPASAYTEKSVTFVNTEGRVQRTQKSVNPPGEAKDDWIIVSEIAKALKIDLGFANLSQLRKEIYNEFKYFEYIGQIIKSEWDKIVCEDKIHKDHLKVNSENYYLTNPISRASKIMAECSRLLINSDINLNKVVT